MAINASNCSSADLTEKFCCWAIAEVDKISDCEVEKKVTDDVVVVKIVGGKRTNHEDAGFYTRGEPTLPPKSSPATASMIGCGLVSVLTHACVGVTYSPTRCPKPKPKSSSPPTEAFRLVDSSLGLVCALTRACALTHARTCACAGRKYAVRRSERE